MQRANWNRPKTDRGWRRRRRAKGLKERGGQQPRTLLARTRIDRDWNIRERLSIHGRRGVSATTGRLSIDEFLMRAMNLMANQSRNYRRRRNYRVAFCRMSTRTSAKKLWTFVVAFIIELTRCFIMLYLYNEYTWKKIFLSRRHLIWQWCTLRRVWRNLKKICCFD